MSWLGVNLNDSLNSIKGQITNFTKDVLAEDEQDESGSGKFPDDDMSMYNRRELEALILKYKHEVGGLYKNKSELEDRLRATDAQSQRKISSIQGDLNKVQEDLRASQCRSAEWGWEAGSQLEGAMPPTSLEDQHRQKQQLSDHEKQQHQLELQALRDKIAALQDSSAISCDSCSQKNHHLHAEPVDYTEVQLRDETEEENAVAISALQQEVHNLSDQLSLSDSEKKNLITKLDELDSEHRQIVEQMLCKKKSLNDDIQLAKTSLLNSKGEIDTLTQSLENKRAEKNELEGKYNILLNQNEFTTKENIKFQDSIRENQREFTSCKSSLDEKKNLIVSLQKNLEELANQLTKSKADAASLAKHANERVQDQTSVVDTLKHLNEELTTKNLSLESEATKISRDICELNDKLTFKDEELLKFDAVLEEKCQEQSHMYTTIKNLQHRISSSEKQFVEEKKLLQEQIQKLQLKNEASESTRQDSVHGSFVEKVQQQCDVQSLTDLPNILSDLRSEIASLRCERDKLHDDCDNTVLELRASQDLLEAVEVEKNDLERECEDLRDQLEELQCGERQPPEGSLTPRSLPTIEEEESEVAVCGQNDDIEQVEGPQEAKSIEEVDDTFIDRSQRSEAVLASNSTRVGATGNQDSSYSEMESKLSLLQDEINKLRSIAIYKDDQIDQLKMAIDQIQEIFGLKDADLRQIYVSIRQEYTSLLAKLDSSDVELEELKKDNSDLEIEKTVSEFKKAEFEKLCSDKLQAKEHALRSMDNILMEIRTENLKLKDDMALLSLKISSFESMERNFEASRKEKDHKLEALSNQNHDLIHRMKELMAIHHSQLSDIEESKNKVISNLETELKLRVNELDSNNVNTTEIKQLTCRIDTLREEVNKLEQKNNASNMEIKNLEGENSSKGVSLIEKEDSLRKLQEENKKLNQDNYNMSLELANLQQERQQMIATSTQKHQESLTYYSKIQELTQIIEQENLRTSQKEQLLKDELLQAGAKLEKSSNRSKENDNFKLQLSSLQNELAKEKESSRKLLDSCSRLQEEINSVTNERDRLRRDKMSVNEQYENARTELIVHQEKEKSLSQDSARLRDHLRQIEDSTNKEATQAEQRENSLRQTIAKLHEKMASHSTLHSNNNQRNVAQVESLQEELRDVIHQRDELQHRSGATEEALLQRQEDLARLQQVLHDFQKHQGREIAAATEREKRRFDEVARRNQESQAEVLQLQDKLRALQSTVKSSEVYKADLQGKQDTIIALKSQVHSVQLAAKKGQEQIALLQSSSDGKVDKPLLRNLFVGYFATPSDKRKEVLRIIAQVLDFSSEERARSGLDTQPGSWMTSVANFLAPPPSNVRVSSKVDLLDHSSLSQAFIRFLEEETEPRPQVRLPAIKMAEEAEKKTQAKTAAKNFTAAAETKGGNSSPLLSATVPLQLPTFHPVAASTDETNPPVEAPDGQVSGPTPLSTPKYLSSLLKNDS